MRSYLTFFMLLCLFQHAFARQNLRFTSTPVTSTSYAEPYAYYPTASSARGEVTIAVKNPSDLPDWLSLKKSIGNNVTTLTGVTSKIQGATGVTSDDAGNFYVASREEHKIYIVDQAGNVEVFAGTGTVGSVDGNKEEATFNGPSDVAFDNSGNLIVTEYYGNKVRKISEAGIVSTIAGTGIAGLTNGSGAEAEFNGLISLAIDPDDQIFLSDQNNHVIRLINTSNEVSTYAGTGTAGFSPDEDRTKALFNRPSGLAIDQNRSLLVADAGNHVIRQIFYMGSVIVRAGGVGEPGHVNDVGIANRFNTPTDVTYHKDFGVLVVDSANQVIRKLGFPAIDYAGSGEMGTKDGQLKEAAFQGLMAIHIDKDLKIMIPQKSDGSIRVIENEVSLSGDPAFDIGVYPISLLASDGVETVEQNFSLSVSQFTVPFFAVFGTPSSDENDIRAVTLRTRNSVDFYSISGGADGDLLPYPNRMTQLPHYNLNEPRIMSSLMIKTGIIIMR
ncbi:MAG: hypothetical protein WBA74_27765 [Cyclobacteriaceae bacterium]